MKRKVKIERDKIWDTNSQYVYFKDKGFLVRGRLVRGTGKSPGYPMRGTVFVDADSLKAVVKIE